MGPNLRMSMGPGARPETEPGEEDRSGAGAAGDPRDDDFIPRRETGLRILLTLLFMVVGSVVETVLAVIVLFELIATLATERAPSPRIRDFANRIIAYYYRVGRYLSYNESRVPFPFSDFPEPIEPDAFSPDDSESRALGLSGEP